MIREVFDPPLDAGIAKEVESLRAAGIETFESCQGGNGHAYNEPTIRFHGDSAEGFRALAAALKAGLKVASLRRTWPILEDEPTGPWWEMTFHPPGTEGLSSRLTPIGWTDTPNDEATDSER